jgi:hypothetical protein
MIREIDQDGDGEVSFEEFKDMMIKLIEEEITRTVTKIAADTRKV